MRLNAIWFVGPNVETNEPGETELCYSKRDASETLRRNPDWVWCNAIELQLPHQLLSLACEEWRAVLN